MIHAAISAMIAFWQCFARRVNGTVARSPVPAPRENHPIDQGTFYCAWGCFRDYGTNPSLRLQDLRNRGARRDGAELAADISFEPRKRWRSRQRKCFKNSHQEPGLVPLLGA